MQEIFNLSTPNGDGATVIAMMNQKGGVGKSTITTLLANVFFFQANLRVAIIDADYPQFTIVKRRNHAIRYIQSKPSVLAHFEQTYSARKPLSVYPANAQQVKAIVNEIKHQYDLIFVDVAGTINQQGIGDLVKVIQHFFIPVLQDDDTILSSIEFYQLLKLHSDKEKSEKSNTAGVQLDKKLVDPVDDISAYLFFNKIPHQNIMEGYRASLSKTFKVLQQYVPAYTAYERELRSTIFPIQPNDIKFQKPVQRLFAFVQEVAAIVNVEFSYQPTPSIHTSSYSFNPPLKMDTSKMDTSVIPSAAANH